MMFNPRYKRLEIEWKHFAVGDATRERCGSTGRALRAVPEELRREFAPLLEDLLAAGVVSTDCPSCSTLAGESTCCRAIEIDDKQYEDIPPAMIKKAAYRALGIGV